MEQDALFEPPPAATVDIDAVLAANAALRTPVQGQAALDDLNDGEGTSHDVG